MITLDEGQNCVMKLLLLVHFKLHLSIKLGMLILHVLIEGAFGAVRLRTILDVAHVVALDFARSPPMALLVFTRNIERHPQGFLMGLPIILNKANLKGN